MSKELLEDSQDIRIINSESDYWKNFEEEVRFNVSRSPTLKHTPRYLMELNSEEPIDTDTKGIEQPDVSGSDGEGRLVIDT